MRQVSLPGFGRSTSQLGFGCAFGPQVSETEALRRLDAAYEAGIRHFDVAPFYLDGRAEAYLGAFLGRRDDVTVTTKYGLLPPSARPLHIQVARRVLGPAVRALRARRAASGAPDGGGVTAKASFRADDARRSLDRSLKLLGRSRVDFFLMHEAEPTDLARPGLVDFLDEEVARGRIGAYGIGGDRTRTQAAVAGAPAFRQVVQFDWDAVHGDVRFPGAFEVLYWVLSRDFAGLRAELAGDPERVRLWSDLVGDDLSDAAVLARLMLKSALLSNPDGLVLVSSSRPEHIAANVATAQDASLDAAALRFLELTAAPLDPRAPRAAGGAR